MKSDKIYGNHTRLIVPIGTMRMQDCFQWLTPHSDFGKIIRVKERFSSYRSNQV